MPVERFKAVVLQRYETQNTSEMIHVVSDRFGPLSLWAKGIQRKSSSLKSSLLQPLHVVEIQATLHDDSDVATLREVDALQDAGALQKDLTAFSLACLFGEMVSFSAVSGQAIEHEFNLLLSLFNQLRSPSWKTDPQYIIWELCQLLECFGYLPIFSDRLNAPWPPGAPKPLCFMLHLETAIIDLPPAEHPKTIKWPLIPEANSQTCLLPPTAVRTLYLLNKGADEPPSMSLPEARQIIFALARFVEFHLDSRLKSLSFFTGLA